VQHWILRQYRSEKRDPARGWPEMKWIPFCMGMGQTRLFPDDLSFGLPMNGDISPEDDLVSEPGRIV
jgi:hypothetical protein